MKMRANTKMIIPTRFRFFSLGGLKFAVDLCESFLSAHGEDCMPHADKDADSPDRLQPIDVFKPSERFVGKMDRKRREMKATDAKGDKRPHKKDDRKNCCHLENPQCFLA